MPDLVYNVEQHLISRFDCTVVTNVEEKTESMI